jgi:hypothetical protein
MKTLLINPWITDFKAYDEWMRPFPLYRFREKHGSVHEIGLIDCLDCRTRQKRDGTFDFLSVEIEKPAVFSAIPRKYKRYGMTLEEFSKRLETFGRPDLVLVTSLMTYWYPGVVTAISEIRKVYPHTRIQLGGIYPALLPGHAASLGPVECVTRLPALNGANGLQPLGAPEMKGVLPLRLVEGCPFSCTYCASRHLFGNRIRTADLEENLMRLDRFVNSGGTEVVFYDDALLYDFNNVFNKFSEYIIKNRIKIHLHVPNGLHARYINPESAKALYQAGAGAIRLGYERHNAEAKSHGQDIANAVAYLRQAGYRGRDIGVYLIVGLDHGLEETKTGVNFLHDLGVKIYMNQYSPVPGSSLFQQKARQYPEILDEPLFQNDFTYIFTHEGFDWDEVWAFKHWVRELNREL